MPKCLGAKSGFSARQMHWPNQYPPEFSHWPLHIPHTSILPSLYSKRTGNKNHQRFVFRS